MLQRCNEYLSMLLVFAYKFIQFEALRINNARHKYISFEHNDYNVAVERSFPSVQRRIIISVLGTTIGAYSGRSVEQLLFMN